MLLLCVPTSRIIILVYIYGEPLPSLLLYVPMARRIISETNKQIKYKMIFKFRNMKLSFLLKVSSQSRKSELRVFGIGHLNIDNF